jgi:hypothetical protein
MSGKIDNKLSTTAMPQPSQSALRWVLAASLACLLLAWPLHQASHAGEPIGKAINAVSSLVAALGDPSVDDAGSGEASADTCLWCLFHAGHFPAAASHAGFCDHAEASPPPTHLSAGLPPAHCPLAAHPRGPPAN